MRRLVLILLAMILLSGCATTQMLEPEQPPDLSVREESALLVIVRDTFFGGAIVFWNYVDGKLIGETKGNTYIVAQLPPGSHYVVAETENTAVALLNFEAGKRYFLRQGIAMGVWRARTSGYSPLSSTEAIASIKGCKYLELDPNAEAKDMDPAVYDKAIEEYLADVQANPEGYKEMLEYKGE